MMTLVKISRHFCRLLPIICIFSMGVLINSNSSVFACENLAIARNMTFPSHPAVVRSVDKVLRDFGEFLPRFFVRFFVK